MRWNIRDLLTLTGIVVPFFVTLRLLWTKAAFDYPIDVIGAVWMIVGLVVLSAGFYGSKKSLMAFGYTLFTFGLLLYLADSWLISMRG